MSELKKALAKLNDEIVISEAYATGVFWNNPDFFAFYPEEKINTKTLLNKQWGFFFGLGRYMAEEKGVTIFDDISVARYVKELGVEKKYEGYGGYDAIEEIMNEVKGKEQNLDAFYNDIKKYALLKNLVGLFGVQVLETDGKYDYRKLSKEVLYTYWHDKVNRLGMDGDNKYDEHFLLDNLETAIDEWDSNPAQGLPFYQSRYMTNICTGWDLGQLYIMGGFGGSGKTSMSFNKVVMSCIENKEKLCVIANEQSVEEFKKMLIITAMGVGTKDVVKRQRINEGNFTAEEREKFLKAVAWVKALTSGDDKLITFVFMEDYIMDDVKKLVRHYANRGIKRFMVDTGKPSEGGSDMARWERFTEDFKELYKLARPNGGGLNLAMWVNVQLADSALTRRFLNEHAFGESKKIKNEASVVFMIRHCWDDEYEGGKSELQCYKFVKDEKNPFQAYKKQEFVLERGKKYALMFTPKNRRGQDNKTGLDVLVLEPNFNNNTWREVGWTVVYDDRNY